MQFNQNYKEFLVELDHVQSKTIYARITALTNNELPVETIEGRITQGSVNLDGASAVRRTCSLTMIATNFDYHDYYWGLNTKFKLEVGVENVINPMYPDIIWFKQGIFLISSFSISHATNNFTIQLQGKDKMCQLNGEIGGTLTASIDFGVMEKEDATKVIHMIKLPIKDIIRNIVHQYAGEPLHNIIINDIDDYGFELLEYRYDLPLYLYRRTNSNLFENILLDGTKECWLKRSDGSPLEYKTLATLGTEHLDMLVDSLSGVSDPVPVTFEVASDNTYYIAKIKDGQTAGYRLTDLTYPGDLIGNVGESVTSVLDKIKNMLGEFEYFYNVDGRFVFQRKQSFINTLWSPQRDTSENANYIESLALSSTRQYSFTGHDLISAFSNQPNLLNVRNDYSVWGQRTTSSGGTIAIHMRYAIDEKPKEYTAITVEMNNAQLWDYNKRYNMLVLGQNSVTYRATTGPYRTEGSIIYCDWREIIYRMAVDYYKYGHILDDFTQRVIDANSEIYPYGVTGYEQYYTDLYTFWRSELYDPLVPSDDYYGSSAGEKFGWKKVVYECPEKLNFWFDFLDSSGELAQFSVKNIGSRPKSINDTNIKSIYFRETPDIVFVKAGESYVNLSGYKYIQYTADEMFAISGQGKSAKDKLDELLYAHGYCSESVNITTIPIYHLEPNTRIYIYDEKTNIDGDYIVSQLSIPLTYNGTMSITATKAAETLL